MRIESLRPSIIRWRLNDTWIWSQFEFERVEAERQSLANGFQGCFLEAPELAENSQARQAACRSNSLRLSLRKELLSEFCRLQVSRLIFEINTDTVCRRPGAEKTEPAGGKTKPDIWQIGKVGTPFLCLLEYYPR